MFDKKAIAITYFSVSFWQTPLNYSFKYKDNLVYTINAYAII